MNRKMALTTVFALFLILTSLLPQELDKNNAGEKACLRIDSLEQRLMSLNTYLVKNYHDPLIRARTRDQINQITFRIDYEKFLLNEELEKARAIISKQIDEAKQNYRNDLVSLFSDYKKEIDHNIKLQKLKYSDLFEKESKYRRYINPYFRKNTPESIERARHTSAIVWRYARETKKNSAAKFVLKYKYKAEALLFDIESNYDLERLTKSEKKFKALFTPLVNSNDLDLYKIAENLTEQCAYYAKRMKTKLDTAYFDRQINIVESRMLAKEKKLTFSGKGNQETLVKRIRQPVNAINKNGVYKFQNKIVVIGYFHPNNNNNDKVTTADLNIMKGYAVLQSDRILYGFINEKIKKTRKTLKVKQSYLVPYQLNGKYEWFLPLNHEGKMQFRVAYHFVDSKEFTKKLLEEYLKPVTFVKKQE